MVTAETKSPKETIKLGERIGKCLIPGDIIALSGELGTGKTQFIKGIAKGIGVSDSKYITSPSFTFINEYHGRILFYHIDLYRLKDENEALELGLEEIFFERNGVSAIEWAEKIPSLLPKEHLTVKISYIGRWNRSIEIVANGKRYKELLQSIGFKIEEE